MPPSADWDLIWEQILLYIEEERVVAIVGPELQRLELGGRTVPVDQVLAERLAATLGVSAEGLGSNPLHCVACRFLERDGDLDLVYSALARELRGAADLPVPAPLLQLAAISPIRLFVSTTVDPMLVRALDTVRAGRGTEVFAFTPDEPVDLPNELARLERTVVYHLFGKISGIPRSFAVTEEDTLEFVLSLQSEVRRLRYLFDEVTRGNLLVLGPRLPDWLTRVLIRLAKRERLSEVRGGRLDILADGAMGRDSGLVPFLGHFSGRTKVYPGDAVEFVAELHRRWTERHPVAEHAAGEISTPAAATPVSERGAVFLSYASEDRGMAQALKEQLEAAHLDVWFDRDDLAGGDRFDASIRSQIQHCSVFVPLLSQRVRTPEPRFFRREWNYAVEVARTVPRTRVFLLPVALDDIPPTATELPEEFLDVHWERLEGGRASDRLIDALRRHFREYQRTHGANA